VISELNSPACTPPPNASPPPSRKADAWFGVVAGRYPLPRRGLSPPASMPAFTGAFCLSPRPPQGRSKCLSPRPLPFKLAELNCQTSNVPSDVPRTSLNCQTSNVPSDPRTAPSPRTARQTSNVPSDGPKQATSPRTAPDAPGPLGPRLLPSHLRAKTFSKTAWTSRPTASQERPAT